MDESPSGAVTQRPAARQWHKLSAWSIAHFAARAIVENVQAALFLAPATYGVARFGVSEYAWSIPLGVVVVVSIAAVLRYIFYSYRVLEDAVEIRHGALFKKQLNLPFARIQNIDTEYPFYFRPLGLATLKVDSAGSTGEEVYLAALEVADAAAIRAYIIERQRELRTGAAARPTESSDVANVCFARSLTDLVIHGLTNNRAVLAIAAIAGFVWQSNITVADIASALGIDFGVLIAGSSIVRLLLLLIVSFVIAMGSIALLSILVSIVSYHGFTIHRTERDLIIKRGLFTKHEIHVRKSRIQTISIRQDWLDFLIGRRNVVLEQISHRPAAAEDDWAKLRKKIVVPSVRLAETAALVREVLPARTIDELPFTPIRKRYFHKHALIASAVYVLAAVLPLLNPALWRFYVPAVAVLWPLHVVLVYWRWKRAGICIDGDTVVARSGAIGIDYHVFAAHKIQDVAHVRTILMRRHDASNVVFHTAASTIRVPYLPTALAKTIVDYCAWSVEARHRSWM